MKRIIVLIGMVFVFLACTGDFKEINTDKSGVTDEDNEPVYKFYSPVRSCTQALCA